MADEGGFTDEQAQEILSDAVAAKDAPEADTESAENKQSETEQLGDAGKKALDAMKRERNQARKELGELRAKLQEFEDRDKTEAQKLAEERDRLAVELTEHKVAQVRRDAAETAGLPPSLAKWIRATDPDEAAEQAKELAQFIKSQEPPAPADLKQGARPVTKQKPSMDSWLRAQMGH